MHRLSVVLWDMRVPVTLLQTTLTLTRNKFDHCPWNYLHYVSSSLEALGAPVASLDLPLTCTCRRPYLCENPTVLTLWTKNFAVAKRSFRLNTTVPCRYNCSHDSCTVWYPDNETVYTTVDDLQTFKNHSSSSAVPSLDHLVNPLWWLNTGTSGRVINFAIFDQYLVLCGKRCNGTVTRNHMRSIEPWHFWSDGHFDGLPVLSFVILRAQLLHDLFVIARFLVLEVLQQNKRERFSWTRCIWGKY